MNRWSVVVATRDRTWSIELVGGRTAVVGEGKGASLEIADAGLAARHVSLLPRDEGVLVEPLRGGGDVLVNDVSTLTQSVLRSGDELRIGRARLLFSMVPSSAAVRTRVCGHDEVMSRLAEEVRRAGLQRPIGLALVASPGLNVAARHALVRRVVDEVEKTGATACFGELSTELLLIVVPEVELGELTMLLNRLPQVAGQRAVVAKALAPQDGLDAHTLLGACWDALMGEVADRSDPVYVNPSMVRLSALLESLASSPGGVCVVGTPGSGRRTLLERLARSAGRRLSVVSALDASLLSRVLARSGDWVLVRDVDRLTPHALLELNAQVKTRLLGTATIAPPGEVFAHVVEVPPLVARQDEVLPLAEAFVSRARAAVGRPRLILGTEARAMLQAWRWPGNVRELANVIARAARATVRDEIGREALPSLLSLEATVDDFRGSMKSAERELLLETLARTRWNVTAAATRLGMPRRTIVHRIAKLGLKRPSR